MNSFYSLMVARERQGELLREAEDGRMARRLRRVGKEREDGRVLSSAAAFRVRWGLAEDEVQIAELLELNGMPRWEAFEERFLVAEKDGRLYGALSYRTESKRLVLGKLVVDPWHGERRLAWALYAGARRLGREMGVGEILASRMPHANYPREAGYRRWGRAWRLDTKKPLSTTEIDAARERSVSARSILNLLGWR